MLANHRRFALFKKLAEREQQAYDDAIAALDDPKLSDDERRERIKAFVEAGHDMIEVASGAETH